MVTDVVTDVVSPLAAAEGAHEPSLVAAGGQRAAIRRALGRAGLRPEPLDRRSLRLLQMYPHLTRGGDDQGGSGEKGEIRGRSGGDQGEIREALASSERCGKVRPPPGCPWPRARRRSAEASAPAEVGVGVGEEQALWEGMGSGGAPVPTLAALITRHTRDLTCMAAKRETTRRGTPHSWHRLYTYADASRSNLRGQGAGLRVRMGPPLRVEA